MATRADSPDPDDLKIRQTSDRTVIRPQDAVDFKPGTDRGSLDANAFCQSVIDRRNASEKYKIDHEIARGGMGAIIKAGDVDLQRLTVLKAILPNVKEDPGLFRRFITEARITAGLEHPNIIPVHDLGVLPDGTPYFSMKLVQGESLAEILRRVDAGDPAYTERYSLYALLSIFRKVCDAIAFAHSKEIIHRDIKPANIMLAKFGEVLVMDWGLARSSHFDEPPPPASLFGSKDDGDRTRFGVIKGTPSYMPPELAKGLADQVDHRTDIFLLGSTLYTIAALQSPYSGDDVYEILANAKSGSFVDPALRAPDRDIPPELSNIILKAMEYKPDDRYQSVEEMSAAIDELLAGHTTSVRRTFATGDFIIREGEMGTEAYMIARGEVEVYKDIHGQLVPLMRLAKGDTVGEMSVISPAPRSASVKALRETEVIVITMDLIERALDKLPPWMGKIVAALSERLRVANDNVHPLAHGDCSYHVLNQLLMLYPRHGTPTTDTLSQNRTLTLNSEDTITEISTSLCAARDPVIHVFAKLFQKGLLRPRGKDRFMIPSYKLLVEFTEFCREQNGFETAFPADAATTALFATEYAVVARHVLPDAGETDAEMKTTVQYTSEKILGCKSSDEIPACFERLYNELVAAQSKK
jgi:serine/threonine protein kinase